MITSLSIEGKQTTIRVDPETEDERLFLQAHAVPVSDLSRRVSPSGHIGDLTQDYITAIVQRIFDSWAGWNYWMMDFNTGKPFDVRPTEDSIVFLDRPSADDIKIAEEKDLIIILRVPIKESEHIEAPYLNTQEAPRIVKDILDECGLLPDGHPRVLVYTDINRDVVSFRADLLKKFDESRDCRVNCTEEDFAPAGLKRSGLKKRARPEPHLHQLGRCAPMVTRQIDLDQLVLMGCVQCHWGGPTLPNATRCPVCGDQSLEAREEG